MIRNSSPASDKNRPASTRVSSGHGPASNRAGRIVPTTAPRRDIPNCGATRPSANICTCIWITGNSANVLRYLGRPLTAAGRPHGNSNNEVMSRVLNFHDGLRVRHWVDHNSVKVYNEQNVLRIETTINMPDMFSVHRRAQGQPHTARKKLRPLRKGVADIPLRAQDKSRGQQSDLRCQQDPRWCKLRRGGGRTSCLLASDLWSQPSVLHRLGHHQHWSAQDASRHTLGRCTNRETDLRPREPTPAPPTRSWPHPKGSQPSPPPPDRQRPPAHLRARRHARRINRAASGHDGLNYRCVDRSCLSPLRPKSRTWFVQIASLRAR
jgi:hypothetical protein